jgi:hypothetical protein
MRQTQKGEVTNSMKRTMHVFLTGLTLAAFSAGAWAETPASAGPAAKDAAAAPAPPPTVTAADVQALKDALAAQQLQIDRLTQLLQKQQDQQTAAEAASKADTRPVPQQQVAVNTVAVPQNDTPSSGLNLQDQPSQTPANPMESPVLGIHFKGITISPGGFVEAAFVRRSRELGADLPTPFNSLTMPGAPQSQLSEFFGSARQSRPTVYVDGRLGNVGFSSYISGDFLSAGVTSTATQTNSYTFRLRQAWGQAQLDNGFSILGGQMWSLVTENKASIAPSDDVGKANDARPATIDPGYNVGFTFARQYGLRVTQNFGDKVAVAVAIENPQGTLTTHNNGDNFLLGEAGASNSYNTTGTYTANPSPDIIVKAAFDPGFGHYEVFGLADRFTDRIYPCGETVTTTTVCNGVAGPNAIGAFNASKEGGGVGANARWNFANKHIVFGLHAFGGNGVGRYGAAQLSDLSIHANGTLNLIRGYQGLSTLEWHGKKLDLYAYAGAEYASRTADFDAITGKYVGYGSPFFKNSGCYVELPPTADTGFTPTPLANCTSDTRSIVEGTLGFWYSFYNGPRGRFRFGTQYSYVSRYTWSGEGFSGAGAPGLSPTGLDNMVYTSFRYYLP